MQFLPLEFFILTDGQMDGRTDGRVTGQSGQKNHIFWTFENCSIFFLLVSHSLKEFERHFMLKVR